MEKLGNILGENIFVRNIVSCQCFVMLPSVCKLGNIFVRNIVSYEDLIFKSSAENFEHHFAPNVSQMSGKICQC